jgi:diguanylate cyclase (GGDEF)-like protein
MPSTNRSMLDPVLWSRLPATLRTPSQRRKAEELLTQMLGAEGVHIQLGEAGPPTPPQYHRFPITYAKSALGALFVLWDIDGRPAEDLLLTARMMARELGIRLKLQAVQDGLKGSNVELARRDFNLYTVYHVSKVLGAVLDMDEVLSLLTDTIAEVMTVRACYVLLQSEDHEMLSVRGLRIPMGDVPPHLLSISITEKVADWLGRLGWEAVPIHDFGEPLLNAAFPDIERHLRAASIELVVPMIHKNRLVGLIALDRKYTGAAFDTRDTDFLSVLAPLAANALSNAQLYELAILDGLTRVYVVRYFKQRCREEIKRSRRYGKALSLVIFDIDHFKRVNDTYGHLMGDRVLHEVAMLLKRCVRLDVDMVARYGGEEFVVLLPETDASGAAVLAERCRRAVEEHTFGLEELRVTISGGICDFPAHAQDYVELVGAADDALFRAKRLGRNRICMARESSQLGSA